MTFEGFAVQVGTLRTFYRDDRGEHPPILVAWWAGDRPDEQGTVLSFPRGQGTGVP